MDIIHITGGLHKTEKSGRIGLFCDNITEGDMSNMSFRVLLSTNAANVGIDNNQIHMGILMGSWRLLDSTVLSPQYEIAK